MRTDIDESSFAQLLPSVRVDCVRHILSLALCLCAHGIVITLSTRSSLRQVLEEGERMAIRDVESLLIIQQLFFIA
jgi:hypothetical protein